MILNKRHFAILSFSLIQSLTLFGQDIGNSPYSRYGIGDILYSGNIRNVGIAGAGLGSPDFRFINFINPASLTQNKVVAFEGGFMYQNKSIRSSAESQRTNGSTPSYGVLAFPLTKKWTSSLGIKPQSIISFERTYSTTVSGDTASSLVVIEQGKGGYNKLFFGNGIQVSKNFSVGAELSYNFGRREVQSAFGLGSISGTSQNVLYRRENLRGFGYKLGAFYQSTIDSAGRLALGMGATFTGPVNYHSDIFLSRQFQQNSIVFTQDTFEITDGNVSTPMEFALGFGLKKSNHYTVSLDVQYAAWSNFKSTYSNPGTQDVFNYRLGFEWIPNYRSVKNVFARSIYRVGVHYEPYAFNVNGSTFNEFGTTFGMSLPIKKINYLNLGFEWGRRGTLENNLILENFARISFGLTINDPLWFKRYRLD